MPVGAIELASPFNVNSDPDDSPFGNAASIVRLPNGGFIIFWSESSPNDGSGGCVLARIFDANGVPAGPQFIVNSLTNGTQAVPDALLLPNGNLMVVWQDSSLQGGDASSGSIRGQIFSTSGVRIGSEFLVNTTTAGNQGAPSTTLLDNGNVIILWNDFSATGGDTSGSSIKAQIVTETGAKVGVEFLINTETSGNQTGAQVAVLDNGNFVVTWQDLSATLGDASGSSIKAQIFDPNGVKIGVEFLVNTEVGGNQNLAQILALPNGTFVVVWQDISGTLGDADSNSIKAQIFDASGQKMGPEFLVNTGTAGGQTNPTIAMVGDAFVIAWRNAVVINDVSEQSFRGQAFNIDGTRRGDEFGAGPISDVIGSPAITDLGDNRFVIAGPRTALINNQQVPQGEFAQFFSLINEVVGTPDPDSLVGTGGYDYIRGLAENDILNGGAGDDVLSGDGGDDIAVGGTGNDEINGGDGADYLIGQDGDDILSGGTGAANILQGGLGDDIYIVDAVGDSVLEVTGEGHDLVRAGIAVYTLQDNIEDLQSTFAGSFLGIGNALGNTIRGGAGQRDDLYGRDGNDYLDDGGGATGSEDTLIGGTGDDTYFVGVAGSSTVELAGEGTDHVVTDFSIYALQANIENLSAASDLAEHSALVGNELDNVITAFMGADGLYGREGNDTLIGGSGAANTLLGQQGNDTYVVTAVGDSIIELAGEGIDTVETDLSVFTLPGNVENLTYTGNATFTGIGSTDNNRLTGGAGSDFLSGLDGDDIIIGGGGSDTLLGGSGVDQFRFLGGDDIDTIVGFTSGEDRIALASTFPLIGTLQFVQGAGAVATTANSTFLYDSATGIISYDYDGTGSRAATQLASVGTGLTLSIGDFMFF